MYELQIVYAKFNLLKIVKTDSCIKFWMHFQTEFPHFGGPIHSLVKSWGLALLAVTPSTTHWFKRFYKTSHHFWLQNVFILDEKGTWMLSNIRKNESIFLHFLVLTNGPSKVLPTFMTLFSSDVLQLERKKKMKALPLEDRKLKSDNCNECIRDHP